MHGSPDPLEAPGAGDASIRQPTLFDVDGASALPQTPPTPLVRVPQLAPDSLLGACPLPYAQYLRMTDHSPNTVACFLSDLRLFIRALGPEMPLRAIAAADLERWLREDQRRRLLRSDPPASEAGPSPADRAQPKTIARRLTFLKNFFGWLVQQEILPASPAEQINRPRPLPPLPSLLHDDEVSRLEEAAHEDVRGHLLVMTLLETGLKKEELLGLRLQDVDLSDPERPAIEVRFPRQDRQRRERRMALSPTWTAVYQRYLERYRPAERVFECTGRNLNYVLAAAVQRTGLRKPVTLQGLRDVYAVRQLRAGNSPEALREKLGLSEEAWYESAEKYRKLAFAL